MGGIMELVSGIIIYSEPSLTMLWQYGDNSTLSDLTEDGGWEVIECHPTNSSQNITMYCANPSCNQLFEGGAEGTIVNLPEDVRANFVSH